MPQDTGIAKLKSRIVKHFEHPYSFQYIHGSNDCCFENIAFSIGAGPDDVTCDEINAFYNFYLEKFIESEGVMISDFIRTMVLNGLLYMGRKLSRCDDAVVKAFEERLDRVCNFAISGEKIFYTEEEKKKYKSVPAVWRNAEIVRYEHTNPYLRLPYVYDLLGFSVMYGVKRETDEKIDKIVEYVLGAGYQKETESGYGIGINGEKGFVKSAYYAVGWDICVSRLTPRQELLYMILFSPIHAARNTDWYKENVRKYADALERNDEAFISEISSSTRKTYWTGGCYLDFGRSRQEKTMKVAEITSSLKF